MTRREVRKKLGKKSESQYRVDDATGSLYYETYRLGVDRVEVEYKGSGTNISDATVVAVRLRDSVGSQNLGSLAQSLRARFGPPSSGRDNLAAGLLDGPATWVDLGCNLVVVVSRREPAWWESGGDLIELEVRRMAAAGTVTVPLSEEVAGFGTSAAPLGADGNLGATDAGSGTTPPVRLADSYVPPAYPRAARRLNLSVRVRLEVMVLPDGSVGEVRVLEGSGTRHGFEEAAIDAVRQWRYTPAMRDGESVAATIEVVVAFQ
jgi:TonB family protein